MAFFDLPREQLETYQPHVECPDDFDDFWQATLAAARQHPLNPVFTPVDFGLTLVDVFDVTFAGYGGQVIKGWLILPRQRAGRLSCVVEYIGYTGGRSYPVDWLVWSNTGRAHLVMDTRGQGSGGRHGDTPDDPEGSIDSHAPGFMTQGILSPQTYYYRRLFVDAVRAVETARSHPEIDPERIAVTGGSQGGGISIAVAGLLPDVQAVMPDVPFLCHYRRAVSIVDTQPYFEITTYLKSHRDKVDEVFRTLSYFDGVNFAERCRARALYSVALMDTICPPSTIYAAYNRVTSQKEIRVYPYNNHEGGGAYQTLEKINFLRALWG